MVEVVISVDSKVPFENGKIGNISHRGDFFMFIPHRRLDKFFYHTLNSSVLISHFVIGC